jgi:hypothetical protein
MKRFAPVTSASAASLGPFVYVALGGALKAFSIAFVASKIAYSLEIEMPVLEWPSSRCAVHLHPVGWADWMI